MSSFARTDPFAPVVGARRGGGQKAGQPDTLAATGLARFSVHPENGLHVRDEDNNEAVARSLVEHAERVLDEARLVNAAVSAGWQARGIDRAGSRWAMVTKQFANARLAGEELQRLGAQDIELDFFPSGSVTVRDGYQRVHVNAEQVHVFKRPAAAEANGAELGSCLQIAYAGLPDYSAGLQADRFGRMLALTSNSKFALTPDVTFAIQEMLTLGLDSGEISDSDRARLRAALKQLS